MEFRAEQIEYFISKTNEVAALAGITYHDSEQCLGTGDEYITEVVEEVAGRVIDLSMARKTIFNYLNHSIATGKGEVYLRMLEAFKPISNYVKDIEIKVLGKPAYEETQANLEAINFSEDISIEDLPPGFQDFKGFEEAMLNQVNEPEKTTEEQTSEFDPTIKAFADIRKDIEISEDDWFKKLWKSEDLVDIHIVAQAIVISDPITPQKTARLFNVIYRNKDTDLIYETLVGRVNGLKMGNSDVDEEAISIRLLTIAVAASISEDTELTLPTVGYMERIKFTYGEIIKPRTSKEILSLILLKLASLQPISSKEKDFLAKVLEANKELEEFHHTLMNILITFSNYYHFINMMESSIRLSGLVKEEED
jgi:hypothetical protein